MIVKIDGKEVTADANGNGMVDAIGKALSEATGISAQLTGFTVASVTGGVDALGDVVVTLQTPEAEVSGRGISTDIVEASARAYLNGLNRLLRAGEKASNTETP